MSWEKGLVYLTANQDNPVTLYPIVAPLNADREGHAVYSVISADYGTYFDGSVIESVSIQLDFRSVNYEKMRDLWIETIETLETNKLILDKGTFFDQYDDTTHMYRRIQEISVFPYFPGVNLLVSSNSFSKSFSRAFG